MSLKRYRLRFLVDVVSSPLLSFNTGPSPACMRDSTQQKMIQKAGHFAQTNSRCLHTHAHRMYSVLTDKSAGWLHQLTREITYNNKFMLSISTLTQDMTVKHEDRRTSNSVLDFKQLG